MTARIAPVDGGKDMDAGGVGEDGQLPRIPASYPATREALHRLAAYVLAPLRERVDGRIHLIPTPGGFGLPPVGAPPRSVRVEGTDLVVEAPGEVVRAPITSLAAAGRLVGIAPAVAWADRFDVPPPGSLDADLTIDERAAAALAGWLAFADRALADARREIPADREPDADAVLWPEHFDLAFEAGRDAAGARGTFGASPGDRHHAAPYLYATSWSGRAPGVGASAPFGGAWLTHEALAGAPDPPAAARAFLRGALAAITTPR